MDPVAILALILSLAAKAADLGSKVAADHKLADAQLLAALAEADQALDLAHAQLRAKIAENNAAIDAELRRAP